MKGEYATERFLASKLRRQREGQPRLVPMRGSELLLPTVQHLASPAY